MRVHTYTAGTEAAITHPEVSPDVRLRELVVIEAEDRVYRVGEEVEIDIEVAVIEIFGTEPGHVIVHHCREIAVTASYAGRDELVTVHPAVHVKHVRAKAIQELKLDPAASADLVLRLPGSTTDMVLTSPIGVYVPKGICNITVDLVHQVRPQG